MKSVFFLVLISILAVYGDKDTFSQLTDSAFNNIQCVPYAYGDFNADKFVDIFCVSNAGEHPSKKSSEFPFKYLNIFAFSSN